MKVHDHENRATCGVSGDEMASWSRTRWRHRGQRGRTM